MTKKTKLMMGMIAIAAAAAGTQALAGAQWGPSLVWITDAYSQANGNLTDVRRTADRTQYIGCQVYGGPGGYKYAACIAADSTGKTRTCSSTAPELIAVASQVDAGTYVVFNWDASGQCSFLQASHYSGFTF
jgi:hypothetical protein